MLSLKSSAIIISWALTLWTVHGQVGTSKDRIRQILPTYEPYTLSIDTRLTERMPHIGYDPGICMGFLIEGTKNRIWTALHCLKEPREEPWEIELIGWKLIAKSKKIPYSLSIEWKTGKLVCSYPEADIAVLEVEWTLPWKLAPKLPTSPLEVGTSYISILSNQSWWFTPISTPNYKITFPTRIFTEWRIIDKSEWILEERDTGNKKSAWVEFLFTDNSPKWGFSWWPLLSERGEVLGIWSFMDGSFGGASSVKNLKELLRRPECK